MKRHALLSVIALGMLGFGAASYAELVAYWPFDDGLGTILSDVTGRGNDGQLRGNVSLPTWEVGHTGDTGDGSLRFLPTTTNRDGAPHVLLGNPDDLKIAGDQTISMWLKPTSLAWGRQNPYSKDYNRSGTITQEPSGSMSYYYGDGGWTGFGSSHQVVEGQWNHVAIVRDLTNGTRTWYINGERRSSTTVKSCVPGDSTAYFGRGYVNNYHGYIDDAAIWNEALSGTEIRFLLDGMGTPDSMPIPLSVVEYNYSVTPNAHSDYYNDEGKDPDEDGVVDNPTGDLTDGPFVVPGAHNTPDDGTVGWQASTAVDLDFDLGTVQPVDWLVIGYSVYSPNGNGAPDDVQIAYSSNGMDYSPFTTYTGFDGEEFRNDLFIELSDVRASHFMLRFDGGSTLGTKYTLDQVLFLRNVPEPAGLLLACLGLIWLLGRRGRRRRRV